jgi:hypothetical protein
MSRGCDVVGNDDSVAQLWLCVTPMFHGNTNALRARARTWAQGAHPPIPQQQCHAAVTWQAMAAVLHGCGLVLPPCSMGT